MSISTKPFQSPSLIVFVVAVVAAVAVGRWVAPTWTVERLMLEVQSDEAGEYVEIDKQRRALGSAVPLDQSMLTEDKLAQLAAREQPELTEQIVYESVALDGQDQQRYYLLTVQRHWGWWSFLPAVTAIVLCWLSREPITALLAGIIVGAMLLGKFNFLENVLITAVGTTQAATILILYLWLLGGLMGVWAKTGASEAFADYMSAKFVRGPRSAKVVAWLLGIIFFQGGTISAVLVGTTVRPLADEEKVSHEELSLVVDATSSPIAVLLAFNAWPQYVQAFMGVAGVTYLATQGDRIAFFFDSIYLSFYSIAAVLATFLISVELHPLMPKKLKAARERARSTGELNAPGSEPLAGNDPNYDFLQPGYTPSMWDFILPLITLLGIAVGTYFALGSPNVVWAFGAALLLAATMAALRGMRLQHIVAGVLDGLKGVVLGSVILLLAITVGGISKEVGGGQYLVSLLGGLELYWLLPALSFLIAVVIAFSTGSSWATFAVTLPLVMPLAFAVGINQNLEDPKLFLSICFVASLNGGVFGDQCSPISDTTILSSLCTGSDLMDHVTTQIPIAAQAAFLALVGWTALAWTCA